MLRRPCAHHPVHIAQGLRHHIQLRPDKPAVHSSQVPAYRIALEGHDRLHRQAAVPGIGGRLHFIFHLQASVRHVRGHLHAGQMGLRHIFRPDGLPDACGLHVEAAVALRKPALLPPGLLDVQGVLHLHHYLVLAVPDQVRDVKGEPGVAAPVAFGIPAVHPHLRQEIRALEMQDVIVLFQPSRVHLDAPSVPDIAVGSLLFYAAELRLIGEGHLYPQAAGEFLLPALLLSPVVIIEAKVPGAVQVFPACSYELESRIVFDVAFHVIGLLFGFLVCVGCLCV